VGIVLAISDPTVEKYSLKAFAICFEFVILVLSTSIVDGLVIDDCLKGQCHHLRIFTAHNKRSFGNCRKSLGLNNRHCFRSVELMKSG
jgi:hypothetical protein